MDDLKKKLEANEEVNTSFRYYVKIPLSKVHSGHPVGENASMNQTVDKRIIERIYELAKKNVTTIKEVKRCLEEFVVKELFSGVPKSSWPRKTNRRYYPSSRDLRNHIARAVAARAEKYIATMIKSLLFEK